jgi:predicted RecA/RadA family phage recombinase
VGDVVAVAMDKSKGGSVADNRAKGIVGIESVKGKPTVTVMDVMIGLSRQATNSNGSVYFDHYISRQWKDFFSSLG